MQCRVSKQKLWSQVWNSKEGSSELRGGDLRVQKAMLLGSVQEVSDAWRFYCCIGIFHVYNGLLPFAVGSRVPWPASATCSPPRDSGRCRNGRKPKSFGGHGAHAAQWGTMRDRKGQNLPKLWLHTSQHSIRRISFWFLYRFDLYSKLYRDAYIHSRYIDMSVLIVLKGSAQWPYHGEALN